MRIITILALISLMLSGCPYGPGRIYDSFLGQDMTLPKVLSYGLKDNQTFQIAYDRVVYLADVELDGKKLRSNMEGSIFQIGLNRTLGRGERAILSITAETEPRSKAPATRLTASSFSLSKKGTPQAWFSVTAPPKARTTATIFPR